MKVVLIGGHLAPALAVMDAFAEDVTCYFIGRKYGFEGDKAITLEYQTITSRNIPFFALTTGRLQRHFSIHTIPSLFKFPYGIYQAITYLSKIKPDVVVGFGGYLSVSVALAARLLNIPIIIHEQTLGLGLANKIIAPFAAKVCVSWEATQKILNSNSVILTGNPIRDEIVHPVVPSIVSDLTFDKPMIYITGGSSGSHAINQLIEGCLIELLQKYYVIHQTGDSKQFNDYDRLLAKKNSLAKELQDRYILKKFIDPKEVGFWFQKSAVIISRSGVNTVTELLYLKKPALLIPLPYAQAQEQLKNAQMLVDFGLGEIVTQGQITSPALYDKIEAMITHQNMYTIKKDEKAYDRIKDAAKNIVTVIKDVATASKTQAQETA